MIAAIIFSIALRTASNAQLPSAIAAARARSSRESPRTAAPRWSQENPT